jgi:pyrroline-5-carboxylate reductase
MADARRIALLGAGKMGQAVLAGLLAAGQDPDDLVVSERVPAAAAHVSERYGVAVRAASDAVADADAVVVVVKPNDVFGLLDEIGPHLRAEAVVLSLAVGLTTQALAAHLPVGTPLVRVMPNTPALVGAGMSVISAAAGTSADSLAVARDVMAAVGEVREIPESLQDAATAVHGSGPAYFFHVVEAMVDAGVMLGLARDLSRDLAVQTIVGAGQMLAQTGESPGTLREQVTSPGGTTAAALFELDAGGVRAAFARAMRACRDRAEELGRR